MDTSISVGDLMKALEAIIAIISGCITAAKDKLGLSNVLTDLHNRLSIVAANANSYIFDQDTGKIWWSSLEACEPLVDNLHMLLRDAASGMSVFSRLKYVLWREKKIEKEVEKLKAQVENLEKVDELYVPVPFPFPIHRVP